jgi:hypothetical protein
MAEQHGDKNSGTLRWTHVHNKDELEAFYRSVLENIRKEAEYHGYAIGVHGSLRRDLDLIAVPWKHDHSDKNDLAAAIQEAACGFPQESYQWEKKPCRRLAVSFPVCWTERSDGFPAETNLGHIDLSVMPDFTARDWDKEVADTRHALDLDTEAARSSTRTNEQPSTQWKFWREARVMELEPYYCYWVSHLTSEGLHDKADIATVLAILHQQRDDAHADALRLHKDKMALIDEKISAPSAIVPKWLVRAGGDCYETWLTDADQAGKQGALPEGLEAHQRGDPRARRRALRVRGRMRAAPHASRARGAASSATASSPSGRRARSC